MSGCLCWWSSPAKVSRALALKLTRPKRRRSTPAVLTSATCHRAASRKRLMQSEFGRGPNSLCINRFLDVPSRSRKEAVDGKRIWATTDFDHLGECDAIIICVPTPLRKTKEPDVSYILAATEEIAKRLRRGQLIILESTTYPGTTDEVLLPKFEERGLKLDEDFMLAFSPERVDPGNPKFLTH